MAAKIGETPRRVPTGRLPVPMKWGFPAVVLGYFLPPKRPCEEALEGAQCQASTTLDARDHLAIPWSRPV